MVFKGPMDSFSRAFLALFIFSLALNAHPKVDPPNYNFSLDQLNTFMPGKKIEDVKEKFGEGEVLRKKGAFEVRKFYVSHIRYKFPLLAQIHKGKITDFYARLPAYFLHDIFHQSIINRIGKQDVYKKVEEQAVYIWKNKNGLRYVYSGACSITCFPVYYSVLPEKSDISGHEPILKAIAKQEAWAITK